MRADIRMAWTLTRGSGRGEGWRIALTALGALAVTGLALAAVAVAAVRGQVSIPFAHGLLNQPGERAGVVLTLVLLLVPVLGFLGQCARIGAVHRHHRMAAMRLTGATPAQVRRIAAVEAAFPSLPGSVAGCALFAALLAAAGHTPPPLAWAGFAVVVLAVPVAAALVGVLALRRVVASPLDEVRRAGPERGPRAAFGFLAAGALISAVGMLLIGPTSVRAAAFPVLVVALVFLTAAGVIWAAGASAAYLGRRLNRRARNPAVLIAAGRLAHDPWAAARTHAALLLVTVVGVAFVGVRGVMLDRLHDDGTLPADLAFYTTGIDLAGAAVLVALAISLCGLAVGTAESLATRRKGLAAQAAAGVPRTVLARAAILETALPLAPALLLAGIGGTAVYVTYARIAGTGVPLAPLLVPPAVYAACLLAAATSLPLLRRAAHPAELRFT
ncbi:Predicted ABC-type transport system involved in lysophospholipase L1 biosynthesis, permease component [Streptomyces sp. LamerLS-316]|uniref:FtsX-like permease family protein n=1 Tax=unclassified Streptomyces TaxID=2593676 RepID=UPI0008237B03|nr:MULTISPECIES: FtsX-like permease family protein [unclassified Streptomyces]MYQ39617.1 ABC transporter permease [Streptomyces sp. SID4921]SCK25642.1 Predicted ABC-type transport system involved in lysophospholipase L1 biosynthesis, permease component [Streptomyces sp. LamerLS-316]